MNAHDMQFGAVGYNEFRKHAKTYIRFTNNDETTVDEALSGHKCLMMFWMSLHCSVDERWMGSILLDVANEQLCKVGRKCQKK